MEGGELTESGDEKSGARDFIRVVVIGRFGPSYSVVISSGLLLVATDLCKTL